MRRAVVFMVVVALFALAVPAIALATTHSSGLVYVGTAGGKSCYVESSVTKDDGLSWTYYGKAASSIGVKTTGIKARERFYKWTVSGWSLLRDTGYIGGSDGYASAKTGWYGSLYDTPKSVANGYFNYGGTSFYSKNVEKRY